jgi:hypothetical protein
MAPVGEKGFMMSQQSQWLSLEEAAQVMTTTTMNVMMHIKRGLLSARESEEGWQIDSASLLGYLDQAGDAARGALCHKSCAKGCANCS